MAIAFKQVNLVKLMVELGHKAAGKWPIEKLGKTIEKEIPNVDEDAVEALDPKRKVTYDKISKALAKGKDWTIEESEAAPAEKTKPAKKAEKVKPGKKGKKTEVSSTKVGGMDRENAGVGSGNGPKGKIGVTATVLDLLMKAGKSKPLYMTDVMKVLEKKFGPGTDADRPLSGLYTTAYAQLNYQLKAYKGYDVRKTDERPCGFWLKSNKPIDSLKKK